MFLLNLSSLLRTISIYQHIVDHRHQHLLEVPNVDWSTIILQMFSRKMDTLYIQNRWHLEYLPTRATNFLIAHLPQLGKKIWFEADCERVANNFEYMTNEHVVKAHFSMLSVKHVSRLDEYY
ncbi:hypothetical protein PMAYCL1PPCAC_20164 [Pristionchus mayeri]|uniref:Uncharacterized protein n=1 Tax=Pristionchus mayeri TaxID=1317129 RepID=A0AAN5CSV5_9BILA|nr:hypothetical protein PMAYCL1PPCAC_20164 [Pristionchus mayeri]